MLTLSLENFGMDTNADHPAAAERRQRNGFLADQAQFDFEV
jgi:hypothetical protein